MEEVAVVVVASDQMQQSLVAEVALLPSVEAAESLPMRVAVAVVGVEAVVAAAVAAVVVLASDQRQQSLAAAAEVAFLQSAEVVESA